VLTFGTLGLFGPLGSLGRLLRMLDGPLLAILPHPSIVFSGPLEAGYLLGFFCAFSRFLGMLRALFAHGASSFFPLGASGPAFFIVVRILSRPTLFSGE
jgi:hypothetical protein